uniref:Phosducin domain-containing protein n=1 Tax=Rhabditophanes sp. KR3021 TaxID=114890 RepID=A0AC35U8N4_9BILA
MATLEEKLLNGPTTVRYCSSSEDEQDSKLKMVEDEPNNPLAPPGNGVSKNTGPKGVKEDYQEYLASKKYERHMKEQAIIAQAKQFNVSTTQGASSSDDEDELVKMRQKRLEAMKNRKRSSVRNLETADDYLTAIEDSRNFFQFIHIFKPNCDACEDVDNVLIALSSRFNNNKYSRINQSVLPISGKFQQNACPALQIYCNDALVGNFVRFDNYFNDEITVDKVITFLKQRDIILQTNLSDTD